MSGEESEGEEAVPRHGASPRGEAVRLGSDDHPLVGWGSHDDLPVAHPARRWQHDLHESDRPSTSARPQTPLMVPYPVNYSALYNLGGESMGVTLEGSAGPLAHRELIPEEFETFAPLSELPSLQYIPGSAVMARRAAREARRRSRSRLSRMFCSCFGVNDDDDDDFDVAAFVAAQVASQLPPATPPIHKIVEFSYELVPQLDKILAAPYYWGRMDRYEAEKILDNMPEGAFLLRDSAQPDFIFSVSFRRYGRTLHARVEQGHNSFSFDIVDTSIFSAPTITKLIENYSDPTRCLFFEPQLTIPLLRRRVFKLQELCRGVIAANTSYPAVAQLGLPHSLSEFIREYHYSVPIRTYLPGAGPAPR